MKIHVVTDTVRESDFVIGEHVGGSQLEAARKPGLVRDRTHFYAVRKFHTTEKFDAKPALVPSISGLATTGRVAVRIHFHADSLQKWPDGRWQAEYVIESWGDPVQLMEISWMAFGD